MTRGWKKSFLHLALISIPCWPSIAAKATLLTSPENPVIAYTWYEGLTTKSGAGTYGTQQIPSGSNIFGARQGATSSTGGIADAARIWMFGGNAYDSNGTLGLLNDLWLFDSATGTWTWQSGSNITTAGVAGFYGSQGVPSSSNVPGARIGATSWTDSNGNFWLFGGNGYDTLSSRRGYLNDLWKYDATTLQWTWIKGANGLFSIGNYGTIGVTSPTNRPGARSNSSVAVDSNGKIWLYGGFGYDYIGRGGYLNDLWKYDPNTNNWTWISGSKTVNPVPTYGTLGLSSALNKPSPKSSSNMWFDDNGKLWIFAGTGKDSAGAIGYQNDLWQYDIASNQWTWVNGSNTVLQNGNYGIQGISDPTNIPGARSAAVSWKDTSGNFWIFGGAGVDSIGSVNTLNDLWQYQPGANEWIWRGGANLNNQNGVWGVQGASSSSNIPSPRFSAVSFSDINGNLWLAGGYGKDSNGSVGYLNDLWKITY